jgi:hypothetical protein
VEEISTTANQTDIRRLVTAIHFLSSRKQRNTYQNAKEKISLADNWLDLELLYS